MAIDDFLKSLGMGNDNEEPQNDRWSQMVKPSSVSIILGRKGFGKSALAYWLCDTRAKQHDLLRVVINLPRERQDLLPDNFVIRRLEDVPRLSDAMVIIDEGTTMLPAGSNLEQMVKGYVALSRQRNQAILFIFHSSSDVGSRILRGVDNILIKEPSQRQIQHGSKDSWWRQLLAEAKEKFEALADLESNPREFTFVDTEDPEFRGMLRNPLPSFWSEELSKAWAGVDNLNQGGLFTLEPSPSILPPVAQGEVRGWHANDPDSTLKYPVTPAMEREAVVVEQHEYQNSCAVILEHPPTGIRWVEFRR